MVAAKPLKDSAVLHLRGPKSLFEKASTHFRLFILITILHIPLGVFDYYAGSFAILHPAAVSLLGLYWAVQTKVRLERVAIVIGYVMGVEILWRMAQIPILWEFGKYFSVAIMITALVTRRLYRIPTLPLVYFVALLPACFLTLTEFNLSAAKDTLSFNMSGPLLLFMSCWFFSYCKTDEEQLRQMFASTIVPLVSVAFATLFFTVTINNIQFTDESNFATSGGFGPNQVSSMLGLGVFCSLFSLIVLNNEQKYKVFLLLVAALFAIQSIMTFSRGGIYNAGGAIILVTLLELRDPLKATKRLAPIAIMMILFFVLVFPALNNFTGGSLQARFEDTQTTHRAEIVESDIDIFMENPIFGVGVGSAYGNREKFLDYKAVSHTEFSRLLSEHGMFGIVSLLSLIAMVVINFRRKQSHANRALVVGVAAWSVLFMFNTGMRLAAPAAIFGMIYITVVAPRRKMIGRKARAVRELRRAAELNV